MNSITTVNLASVKEAKPMKAAFLSLSKNWAAFYEVFLSPGVMILILATSCLVYLAETAGPEELPQTLRIAFTVVVSVLSSVVGALVWKRWNDAAESSILVTRGKSAVRGLNLLLQSLTAAEARVIRFRNGARSTPNPTEYFSLMCDEIQDRIDFLGRDTCPSCGETIDSDSVIPMKYHEMRFDLRPEATKVVSSEEGSKE